MPSASIWTAWRAWTQEKNYLKLHTCLYQNYYNSFKVQLSFDNYSLRFKIRLDQIKH